jgi:hypothetical protein
MSISRTQPIGQALAQYHSLCEIGSDPTREEILEHNSRVLRSVIHDLGGRLLGGRITEGSPKGTKIETLLKYSMPVSEIASVIESPIEEVELYIANRNIPEDSQLTAAQIVKIDTLLARGVPLPEISSVLSIAQVVIEIYQGNLRHLATAQPAPAAQGTGSRERKEEQKQFRPPAGAGGDRHGTSREDRKGSEVPWYSSLYAQDDTSSQYQASAAASQHASSQPKRSTAAASNRGRTSAQPAPLQLPAEVAAAYALASRPASSSQPATFQQKRSTSAVSAYPPASTSRGAPAGAQSRQSVGTPSGPAGAAGAGAPATDEVARYLLSFGQHMETYVDQQTYQGLSPAEWKEYKAAALPLHWAIEHGHVHLFPNHKDDLFKCNAEGYLPLQWAAIKGPGRAIKPLIDMGARPQQIDRAGHSACDDISVDRILVFLAAKNDQGDVIRELAKYGVNINHIHYEHAKGYSGQMRTAFMYAASLAKPNAVQALVDVRAELTPTSKDCDTHYYSIDRWNPFFEAACRSRAGDDPAVVATVKILLPYAPVNKDTLCAVANSSSSLRVLKVLFESNASFKQFATDALLTLAGHSIDQEDAAVYLIQQGAKPGPEHLMALARKMKPIPKTARVILKHTPTAILAKHGSQLLNAIKTKAGWGEMVALLAEFGVNS